MIGEVTDGIMQSFAGNVEEMLSAPTQRPATVRTMDGQPVGSSEPPPAATTSARATEPATGPAGSDLDVWRLVVRPMLARHSGAIVTVGLSGLAAYLGARLGTRRAHRTV